MDFNALQHKLFAMDPVDPREDIAKLKAQATGAAPAIASESVDYITESASVPEGSLKMDKNYSIDDFAALAGVTVSEKRQRDADQVRGKEPMPKAKPGRSDHPYQDRLVGDSIDYDDTMEGLRVIQTGQPNNAPAPAQGQQTVQQLTQRLQQTEQRLQKVEDLLKRLQAALSQTAQAAPVQERELTRGVEREKERLVKGMKKNKSDFKDRYGDDAESVMYATATKRAKSNESVDSIKNSLYAALNKKMGVK